MYARTVKKTNFLQEEPVKYSVELLSLKQIETTMITFYTLRKGRRSTHGIPF